MMLEIRDFSIRIGSYDVVLIDRLRVFKGQRVGLVGESGSGKTLTAMSVVGLQPRLALVSGSIRLDGRELVGMNESELTRVRGGEIGLVFQDPLRALNPVMRVGRQIAEAIRLHDQLSRSQVHDRVWELLSEVELSDAKKLLRRYPHQLSGGQRQRVLIAIAIASRPKLLIADEPTTALDVTIQQGILELLVRLSDERNMALLFVSHDLGVVRAVTESIAVMYGGRIMEVGLSDTIIKYPRHRYTQALIAANPGGGLSANPEVSLGRPFATVKGSVPPLGSFPPGCRFRGRCLHEIENCAEDPPATSAGSDHWFCCWNPTTPEATVDVSTH